MVSTTLRFTPNAIAQIFMTLFIEFAFLQPKNICVEEEFCGLRKKIWRR
jgi:hypothetical protein